MKYILFFLFLFFLMASCNRSFHYKLEDFDNHYSKSFENNDAYHLPKCWNGWFELRIKRTTEIVDGVEIRKFDLDPNLNLLIEANYTSLEFYGYIAFIDDHRLVFYYRPHSIFPTKIEEEFNLYDSKQTSFHRGYYNYTHFADSISTVGNLEVLLENRKRSRKRKPKRKLKGITNLTFEVQYSKNSEGNFEAANLKLVKMNDLDDTQLEGNNTRDYIADSLFSFQPTYYFEGNRKLKLTAKSQKKGSPELVVDSIFLDTTNRERFYYFNKKLLFQERLKEDSGALKTW